MPFRHGHHTYTVRLESGEAGRGELLRDGACHDLPPAVVDRYFLAHGVNERFAHLTAVSICARCPVQEACLVDAIVSPRTTNGVRGGRAAHAIAALRWHYGRSGESAWRIARRDLASFVPPFRGAYGAERMRRGKFLTHLPLLAPDEGGH